MKRITNRQFFIIAIMIVCATIILVYRIGFMALVRAVPGDRLRDIVFPIWDSHPLAAHGFLSFNSAEEFASRKLYLGHTQAYMLFMYVLYKLNGVIGLASLRVYSFLGMAFLSIPLLRVSKELIGEVGIGLREAFLALLALLFLITSPFYWVSLGKINADNPMFLTCGFLFLSSYFAAVINSNSRLYILSSIPVVLFAPLISVLQSVFFILLEFFSESKRGLLRPAGVVLLISLVSSSVGPIISKIMGFTPSSSSWIFRAGLDGDISYFVNFFQSLFYPLYPRNSFYLALPFVFLGSQLLCAKLDRGIAISTWLSDSIDWFVLYGGIASYYVTTLALWPQSVSIHPYLYDFMLLLPVYLAIFFNFLLYRFSVRFFVVMSTILWILIQSNLIVIAQSGRNPKNIPDFPVTCTAWGCGEQMRTK
ncbi:MAG: hypothetical protein L7F78_04430 [Syntrophales bacterium LBB04]|nr:hypothetical protein [Syntrophales bacterium LBB04]